VVIGGREWEGDLVLVMVAWELICDDNDNEGIRERRHTKGGILVAGTDMQNDCHVTERSKGG
jgi:hypothetical protein